MNSPLVSVLIVVRNGCRDILGALESIQGQDYAPIEVIVVDGISDDGTRELVENYARGQRKFPLLLLDNPGRIQASGWNVGIRAANGEFVLRLDAAHCRLESNYVRCCLENLLKLRQTDPTVAAVGGRRTSVAATENTWCEAIAIAQSSRFGVGNAAYRLNTKAGFVDTVGVPVYERRILLRAGLFNESLGRSEDNEFHARLRQQGFKLYFFPDAVAVYHPRTTLAALASQMFHNGWWITATVMRMHSFPFGIRHIIPFGFYLSLAVLGGFSGAGFFSARVLLCALLGIYICASIGSALYAFPCRQFWRVVMVFWLMHACYAGGTLAGFFARRGDPAVGQATAPGANVGS